MAKKGWRGSGLGVGCLLRGRVGRISRAAHPVAGRGPVCWDCFKGLCTRLDDSLATDEGLQRGGNALPWGVGWAGQSGGKDAGMEARQRVGEGMGPPQG